MQLSRVTGTTQAYFGTSFETDDANAPVNPYPAAPPAPPANGIPTAP